MCLRKLTLPFAVEVDGMDAAAERAYQAWPSRLYLVGRDGKVAFQTRLGELDFQPADSSARFVRSWRRETPMRTSGSAAARFTWLVLWLALRIRPAATGSGGAPSPRHRTCTRPANSKAAIPEYRAYLKQTPEQRDGTLQPGRGALRARATTKRPSPNTRRRWNRSRTTCRSD